MVRLQYVLAMSGYDLNRFRRPVAEQLAAIAMTEPRTAYETTMKQRAARLQELLNANQTREYLALINRYQGYPSG